MNLPEDILKHVNSKNWENVWFNEMTVMTTGGKKWETEYVWEPDFTKRFIKILLKIQKKEILLKVKTV